jgi:hypothetical protein
MSKFVVLGARTLENLNFLRRLVQLTSNLSIKKFLKNASADEYGCLIDCAANILDIRFPLKTQHRRRLKEHAEFVRKMGRARSVRRVGEIVQKASVSAIRSLILPVLAQAHQNAAYDLGSRIGIQVSHRSKR